MKFTFTEWQTIRHNMEVAELEYKERMNESKPSDDALSMYQIFKRQQEETRRLINKLNNMEI